MPAMKYYLVLFLPLFILCTTQDGILGFTQGRGSILVTDKSNTVAYIFVNNRNTGKTTPALLENVIPGRYSIRVFAENHSSQPDSFVIEVSADRSHDVQFDLKRVPSGNLHVQTNPDDALVTINGLQHGYSPVSIAGLAAGRYEIALSRGNYNYHLNNVQVNTDQTTNLTGITLVAEKRVLVEYFGNTGCPPCPDISVAVRNLLNEMGRERMVMVSYNVFWPSQNDPFHLYTRESQNAVWEYYGKSGRLPDVLVGGKRVSFRNASDLGSALEEQLNDALSKPSFPVLYFKRSGLDSIYVVVDPAGADLSATVLRIALVEDYIEFDSPPGSNGQKVYRDIFRDYYPGQEGIAITGNSRNSFYFSFDISRLQGTGLTVVAYLQDETTKSVLEVISIQL